MTKEPYVARTGQTLFRPVMTSSEYAEYQEDYMGFCLACGNEAEGVEPDARRYTCASCHQPMVFGLEGLLLRSILVFREPTQTHP